MRTKRLKNSNLMFGKDKVTQRIKSYSIIDSVNICYRCASIETCLLILMVVIHSVLPYFLVYCNSEFINKILEYNQSEGEIKQIVITIAQLAFIFFMMYFHAIVIRLLSEKIAIHLRNKFNIEIMDKCINLKYEYIEDGETCDLINRILHYPGLDVIQNTFQHIMLGIEVFIQVVLVGVLLFKHIWWAIPMILVCMIPLVITAWHSSMEKYSVVRWNSMHARKSNYLEFEVLRSRNNAVERNLFGYAKYYNNQFENYFRKSMKNEKDISIKWFFRMRVSSLLVTLVIISIACSLFGSLKAETISIGFFISVVESLFSLENILVNQVQNIIALLVQDKEYFKDLTKFSELEEERHLGFYNFEDEEIETIEFKEVFFKYPGTNEYILKGISFLLEKGKHYAIVGTNGSGKTTITKLLLRLYRVNKGEILINGRSIYDYSIEKVYSMFSVVYQDYTRYAISVKENIGIGNLKYQTDEKIKEVVEAVGLKEMIEALPEGYDTPLGKVLQNGVDLSGGQWQRVALARTLMREKTLKILDEPTSSLDPIQESNLYKNYGKIAKGSTTIFISHRLGSTKLADKILLIDDGKIIGSGSHAELIKEQELYREMFCKQKEWYDEN